MMKCEVEMKKVLMAFALGMLATSAQAVVVSSAPAVMVATVAAAKSARESAIAKDDSQEATYDGKFHCEPKYIPITKRLFSDDGTFKESFEKAKRECLTDMKELGLTGKFEGFTVRPIRTVNDSYLYKFLMRFSIDNFE